MSRSQADLQKPASSCLFSISNKSQSFSLEPNYPLNLCWGRFRPLHFIMGTLLISTRSDTTYPSLARVLYSAGLGVPVPWFCGEVKSFRGCQSCHYLWPWCALCESCPVMTLWFAVFPQAGGPLCLSLRLSKALFMFTTHFCIVRTWSGRGGRKVQSTQFLIACHPIHWQLIIQGCQIPR